MKYAQSNPYFKMIAREFLEESQLQNEEQPNKFPKFKYVLDRNNVMHIGDQDSMLMAVF